MAGVLGCGPASAFDANNKVELEKFIHDYLVSHPEVLIEAQDALQAKQAEAQKSRDSKVIAENKAEIFRSSDDLVVGNPKGDVSVVEFYDYNCPYCKHAVADMKTLVANDPGVRFVLKEFPILGQDSVAASRVSIAVQMIAPDKFRQFHDALFDSQQRADGDFAMAVATKLGIDKTALTKKLADPSIDARIRATYSLADKLNITGTPAYIVGDEEIAGVVGAGALEQKVQNVRKCNSAAC